MLNSLINYAKSKNWTKHKDPLRVNTISADVAWSLSTTWTPAINSISALSFLMRVVLTLKMLESPLTPRSYLKISQMKRQRVNKSMSMSTAQIQLWKDFKMLRVLPKELECMTPKSLLTGLWQPISTTRIVHQPLIPWVLRSCLRLVRITCGLSTTWRWLHPRRQSLVACRRVS